jgi:NAD(P)-dependent dehydrogenase (short-subunit alcohol dehydrogenase family)
MAGNKSGAVVVTGASTGIGRATAQLLDSKGYRVFAGVRKQADAESLEEEGSERLTPIIIDVTKHRSIFAAKQKVRGAVGKDGLVGLVNNAGVGGGGPVEFTPIAEFRKTLEVNLVGQVAVTKAFLPLIREAQGTIVFIASIGGRIGNPFMSPYSASKFGIEGLGESLRGELRPWNIDVAVIEPGSIDTEIWGKGAETAAAQASKMPDAAWRLYGRQLSRFGELITETASRGISPEKVARVVHKAIRSNRPRHRYLVGTDAKVAARLKGNLPERTFQRMLNGRLKMPTDDIPAK